MLVVPTPPGPGTCATTPPELFFRGAALLLEHFTWSWSFGWDPFDQDFLFLSLHIRVRPLGTTVRGAHLTSASPNGAAPSCMLVNRRATEATGSDIERNVLEMSRGYRVFFRPFIVQFMKGRYGRAKENNSAHYRATASLLDKPDGAV